MRPEDFDSFSEVVTGFAEIKGRQLSAAGIKLYWNAMQHWSIEDFRKAAEHLLRTCDWMPEPKHFEDLRKAGRPTPGEAWQRALHHCQYGAWRKGEGCGDPRIDAAIAACGGWARIALCDQSSLGFEERRFAEHYETGIDANDTRRAVPELTADDRALERLVETATPRLT